MTWTSARSSLEQMGNTTNGKQEIIFSRFFDRAKAEHSAGAYIAFDLDPMAPASANDHNVFIFVIHAIDGYSVYQIANDNYLRNVALTPYTPSQGKDDAKFWEPQGSTDTAPPLPPRNPNANTRQVAVSTTPELRGI
ncbi:hypothetical protein FRC10_009401 [Ceratobasidium sp. 414]|nr:hypothetical protein FRC10_009401 [Ceratobasidium sp. 414]